MKRHQIIIFILIAVSLISQIAISSTNVSKIRLIPSHNANKHTSTTQITINETKKLIEEDKGCDALPILKQLIAQKPSYDTYVLAGQASAMCDQPKQSLEYYKEALNRAKQNKLKQRIALFGMGKMQMWLDDYKGTEQTYRRLLTMKMNKTDHELALAGLVKALAYQDKPMQAYSLVPQNIHYRTPEMVVAASQAAFWSGWADKSKNILDANTKLINSIEPGWYLRNDLKEIEYEIAAANAENTVTPAFDFEHDNDGLTILHYNTAYSRRFTPDFTAGFIAHHSTIRQSSKDDSEAGGTIEANGLFLQSFWQQNDYLSYLVNFGSIDYESWHPALWSANVFYTPNDTFSFSLLNQQEAIETIDAINNHIYSNTSAIGVNYNPFYRLRFATSLSYESFSDSNNREGYYATANYLIFDSLGLGAGLRVRGFWDSKTDTVGYFNPKNLHEQDLILTLSRRLVTNWRYYIDLGVIGHQTINPGDTSYPQFAEAGIRGFITKFLLLNAYLGISNSDFDSISGSGGYRRTYGAASLSVFF